MIVYVGKISRNSLNLRGLSNYSHLCKENSEVKTADTSVLVISGAVVSFRTCCFLFVSKLWLPFGEPSIDLMRTSKYDSFLPTPVMTDILYFCYMSPFFFYWKHTAIYIQ